MANRKIADGMHVPQDGGGTRLMTRECHSGNHGECRMRVREDRLLEVVTLPCECRCHVLVSAGSIAGELVRIIIDAPAQLLTMNTARSIDRFKWADLTKAWRTATAERAWKLRVPPVIGLVGIEARPHQYGGVLADPGAHMPCVKACIDGLRDANVLEDDTGDYVAWIRLWAPLKSAGAGMVLELVPAS